MGKVKAEAARQPTKRPLRRYAAARVNRQNAEWTTESVTANWSLYRNLRTLRARARQMSKDAPHFRKFLLMARQNVIGHAGIKLQCRAEFGSGRPMTKLNQRAENAWWEWCYAENCSVSGKLSWVEAQNLVLEHLIRDGEFLVEHVDAMNPFGYALKFWNVDYLDETYNEELPNGNRVIMSVEVDAVGRPVAYHLTTPASDINFTNRRVRERVRIPAERMTHGFMVTEDESQARGVTWFHAVLLQGKDLHEYTGGVVMQARVAAYTMGFLESEPGDETEFTGQKDEDGVEQPIKIDASPLSMNELPAGMKLTQFDPKQPTQNHAEFKKSMILDEAAGLGVNGFSLSGDMSAVNYSSARVGLGEERDLWRMLQTFVSEKFCRVVYHKWLRSAMISGKLPLTPREYMQLQNPAWRARGWRYVDPQKEIGANVEALANNLATWSDLLGEQGHDFEEFLARKQADDRLAAKYGVTLAVAPKTKAETPAAADEEDEDDGEKGDESDES